MTIVNNQSGKEINMKLTLSVTTNVIVIAVLFMWAAKTNADPVIVLKVERPSVLTGEPIILRSEVSHIGAPYKHYSQGFSYNGGMLFEIQNCKAEEEFSDDPDWTYKDVDYYSIYPPCHRHDYRDCYAISGYNLTSTQAVARVDVQVFSPGKYKLRAIMREGSIHDEGARVFKSNPVVVEVLPVPPTEPITELRDGKTAFKFGVCLAESHWFENGDTGCTHYKMIRDKVLADMDHRLRPYVLYAYVRYLLGYNIGNEKETPAVQQALSMAQEFMTRYDHSWLAPDLYLTLYDYYRLSGKEMLNEAVAMGRKALESDPMNVQVGEAFVRYLEKMESQIGVKTAPVISVIGANPITLECGTTYTDADATATDNKDGDLTASITVQNSVNAAATGTYTIVYSVSDTDGNTASATRTVNVVDTTPPVLTCLSHQTQKPVACGGAVNFIGPTAADQCDGAVTVTCSPSSGAALPPGIHTVNCTATDAAGNTGTCAFTVDVKERLRVRFLPPLQDDNADDNIETDADVVNQFKVGSRVVHKVKLFDCAGNDVTAMYAPLVTVRLEVTLRTTTNTGSELSNDVPENYNGVGNAGGLMIPVGGQFQYNLDTTGYVAGTVNDGRFYRSHVTVEWVSAPGVVVGEEDALLESK